MPVNLSVKNVPESLAEALRTRAESNHRSLQGELMSILEQATGQRATPSRVTGVRSKLSVEEVAARASALFAQGTPNSVETLRAMRDGRYGDSWSSSGNHALPD